MATDAFDLICPACGAALSAASLDERLCPVDGTRYRCIDGIWRFLTPARAQVLGQFIREYESVRAAEGRGSDDPAYYRILPYADLTGRFSRDWQIRAAGYDALIARVFNPLENGRPLRVLDLGAGNGWLAFRLSQRGHHVAAVDLLTNDRDGLGAHRHYDSAFTCIQAEFDCLPLEGGQFNLAIFNSSLHYSSNYETTLYAACRVLREDGELVILDTPVYQEGLNGVRMLAEQQERFLRVYGFRSDSIHSEGFLTLNRLDELGRKLGIGWQRFTPFRGWRWALRPWRARLARTREPAEFMLIVGRRRQP